MLHGLAEGVGYPGGAAEVVGVEVINLGGSGIEARSRLLAHGCFAVLLYAVAYGAARWREGQNQVKCYKCERLHDVVCFVVLIYDFFVLRLRIIVIVVYCIYFLIKIISPNKKRKQLLFPMVSS